MKLPAPANDADFERLCLRLLKVHWNCPDLERYGHRGEAQQGIDILDMSGAEPLHAAQCKLYDPRKTLPPTDIHAEVNAARTFTPAIGIYGLLTTAKVSTEAHNTIIEINRKYGGSFRVELFTWDRIDELLDEYPLLRDQIYKTLSGEALQQIQDKLTEIGTGVDTVKVTIASQSRDTSDSLHAEIDEARHLIEGGQFQTGRFLLQRLRTHKWEQMGNRHRFRLLSNVGAAYFRERDFGKAAQFFLEAASCQPNDVQAAENQGVAYHISLPREQAFKEITELQNKFPNSPRIVSLWITSAPETWSIQEIESRLSAAQKSTAEVMTALGMRAFRECKFELSEQFASRSIELLPGWSKPRSLKAHSFLMQIVQSQNTFAPAAETDRLRRAQLLFTEALDIAAKEHDPATQSECLLERSQVYLLLKEPAQADADVERAHTLMPDDQGVRSAWATMMLRRGQVDEAINELRIILAERNRPDVALQLAKAMLKRRSTADINEAIDLLFPLVTSSDRVPSGAREYVASILLGELLVAERWSDAERVCETLPACGVSSALVLAYRARISYVRGNPAEANELVDSGLAALTDSSSREDIYWIAQLLSDLGRHSDALPLLQRVATVNELTDSTKHLLNCAMRLKRDDLIIDTCAALRKNGIVERDLVCLEAQTLETYDVDGAIAALNEYLQRYPDDKLIRLRMSVIGVNWNRPGIIDARPNSMPSVHEVDALTGRLVVQIMKLGGYPDAALAYGYEVLRRHFNDPEGHKAFMFNLLPAEPRPIVAEFTEVKVGAAVSYVEDGDTQIRWMIIEDADNPDTARKEYAPQHPLAAALLGKKVGDKVVLARGAISERTGRITSILNKYVFRYQDSFENWQFRFPGTSEIESVKVLNTSKAGKEEFDFSQIVASVEQLAANVQRLKELYRSIPAPIHMIGAARGKETIETTVYFAQEDDVSVFCCNGTADERDAAFGALSVSNTWLIEPSALATIFMLELENFLSNLPVTLAISQGTLAELNEMLREATLFQGEGGVLTKSGAGIAFVQITQADREARRQLLNTRIEKIKTICKVMGCVELAKLDAQHREMMIKGLGQGGAESILLASNAGHLLWTDDSRLASFARTEHGTKSAWTQSVLQWAEQKGYVDAESVAASTARLIGLGYVFTSPSLLALIEAAKLADWDSAKWPLSAAIDQLGSETILVGDAATLAIHFMDRVFREIILDERRRSILRTILDKLANRKGGIQAIQAIKTAIPNFFGLNALGATDAVNTIETWLKGRTIRIDI